MQSLKSTLLAAALAACCAAMAGAQEGRAPTRREAGSRVKHSETKPPPEEPEYRELRCRGAYDMRIKVGEWGRGAAGEQLMQMVVIFDPVYKPTDDWAANLGAGQCAFYGQTPPGAIPSEVHLRIVAFGQLKQKLNGSAVDESPTAAERFPDAQNVPEYLKDSGHYWIFYVKNTGRGILEASNGRHWKPQRRLRPSDIRRQVRIMP